LSSRKVVITGLGMVSPVGLDRDSSWQALKAGKSGIATLEGFDLESLKTTIGGQINDFDPTVAMDLKESRKADRFSQLAMAASVEAMTHANLTEVADPEDRKSVV